MSNITEIKFVFNNGDINEEKINCIENLLEDISMCLAKNEISTSPQEELINSMGNEINYFSKLANDLNIFNDSQKIKSYYLGYINALIKLKTMQNEFRNQVFMHKKILKHKYMEEFLDNLYHKNVLTYGDIYSLLLKRYPDLKKSALSNFLNKIQCYDIYHKIREKNVIFYLITQTGREVYQAISKKEENDSKVQIYNEFIQDLLKNISFEVKRGTFDTDCVEYRLAKYNKYHLLAAPKTFHKNLTCTLQVCEASTFKKRFNTGVGSALVVNSENKSEYFLQRGMI